MPHGSRAWALPKRLPFGITLWLIVRILPFYSISKELGVDIAGKRNLARLTESLRTRGKGSRVQRLAVETRQLVTNRGVTNEFKCLRPMSIGFSLGSAFRARPSMVTLVTQFACLLDA